MKEIQQTVAELTEEICDQHCRYNKFINEEGCIYCRTHENKCYLDKLLVAVGLKDKEGE